MLKTKVTGKGHGTFLKRQEQRMRNERGKNLCKTKRMGEKWNEFVYLAGARNASQGERISLPKPALARTEARSGAPLMCILEGPTMLVVN